MPWTEKQLRLFRAAAHNPEIAKRTGIKQSDAERMSKEGLKKAKGGILKQDTRHGKVDMPFQKLNRFAGMKKGGLMRSKKDIEKDQMGMAPYKRGGEMKESKSMIKKEIAFFKKKGAPASMIKHEEAEAKGYKKGGSIKETMGPRGMGQDVEKGSKLKHGEHSEQKRGHTRGTVIKMAAGGSVRAHGEHSIQKKGHTRGKVC